MKSWLVKNKRFIYIIAIFLAVLVYFIPYYRSGLPQTHDSENHVARFAQYYLALRQGQIIPRFAPMLENNYGYPVFNYNYPLANILSLPLTILHVNFETEFKLIIIAFALLGTYSLSQLLPLLFGNDKTHEVPILALLLAPYLWSSIWYRGNIGEVLIYFLLPILLWQIERLRLHQPFARTTLIISLAAFFLAHNIMVLFISPFIIAYACWRLPIFTGSSHKINWQIILLALIGLGLSLWFWLPAFFEKDQVILSQAGINNEYTEHFATARQLLNFIPSGGLSYPGSIDGLNYGLGLIFIFTFFISIVLLCRYIFSRSQKCISTFKNPALAYTLIILTFILLWLQTSASQFVWSHLPFVNFIQFPWRLGLITQFLLVLQLANLSINTRVQKSFWFLIIIAQIILCTHVIPTQYFSHTREDYLFYPQSTTTRRENTPINFTFPIEAEATSTPYIAQGRGAITNISRLDTTNKIYTVTCEDECLVIEHTTYFPGFITYVDGKKVDYLDNDLVQGRLAYIVSDHTHDIHTIFRDNTPARIIGDALSIISICILVYFAFRDYQSNKL